MNDKSVKFSEPVTNRYVLALTIFSIVVLLHAAVLYSMGAWLWGREHYQFFPIVLLGSATFAWFRLRDTEWTITPGLSIRVMLYGLASATLFGFGILAKSR